MKIYDISQELFGSVVFPGDQAPEKFELKRMSRGDSHNLTALSLCAHNGTHVDAPFHFIADGETIEQVALDRFVGRCVVVEAEGVLTREQAEALLAPLSGEAAKKVLLKGGAVLGEGAAQVFVAAGVGLVGVEPQTVGPQDAPMATHLVLLGAGVIALEGIRLGGVPAGEYLLCAAPISLAGSDGAPCRAFLIED